MSRGEPPWIYIYEDGYLNINSCYEFLLYMHYIVGRSAYILDFLRAIESRQILGTPRYSGFFLTPSELGDIALYILQSWSGNFLYS